MILYKYLPPARLDVLENGKVRFTQPSALNDPFESLPLSSDLIESIVQHSYQKWEKDFINIAGSIPRNLQYEAQIMMPLQARREISKWFEKTRNETGILSLSKKKKNILMWSHYSDSHKGYVVGFDTTHNFFQKKEKRQIAGLQKIEYSKIRPKIPSYEQIMSQRKEDAQQVVNSIFYTKSPHWEYEKEWRLIKSLNTRHKERVIDGIPIYLFDFPLECIKEVVIGAMATDSLRSEIVRLVKSKYQAKIFKAQISQTKFEVTLNEID